MHRLHGLFPRCKRGRIIQQLHCVALHPHPERRLLLAIFLILDDSFRGEITPGVVTAEDDRFALSQVDQ